MEAKPASADEFSAAVAAVTSAFGDPTRRQIYLFVREHSGATAGEVAANFDLHANVARHHLDKLVSGGYLTVFVQKSATTGAGRPSKRYRASDKDMTLEFPTRRDDLLVTLLARTLAMVPRDEAECMAELVGEEYGRSLAADMVPAQAQRSLRSALGSVADALTAHGFAAHAEARGASVAIIAEHCPFGDAASQHPFICAVDRGIVKGMLGELYGQSTPVTMTSRARGDDTCATVV
ncbi:MAG: helix-turn-helix transcriptional regulator [Acidimicrobiales bacterium]